ncbi:MAG: amidohydrolase family protein [Bacteroidota bacterium]
MRKISADLILPVDRDPIKEGVLIVDESGQILSIDNREAHDRPSLEIYTGAIVPGFVNTHCHLELSHMKGKVDTGTGLIPFIKNVVQFRDFPEEVIQAAIIAADKEMYEEGVVAVGDISNKIDTAACKRKSAIRYYTFVEMFDFLQDAGASTEFTKYKAVYDEQADGNGNRKSGVPHAPYSVSETLFGMLNSMNTEPCTVSIHNQETLEEHRLFMDKTGGFLDFYGGFGITLDAFEATGQPSIHYALKHMDPAQRSLFVHNTTTTAADIRAAQDWSDQVYWATCPNANLYIENRLPDYQAFLDTEARLTIGTDSLTSNWQLSVLEEMKTIARYQSFLSFETLLRWATLNGAQALGFDDELGSITVGKRPGLVLLNLEAGMQLSAATRAKRIV